LTAVHRAFEAALPAMDQTIRFQFRNWPRRHRAEAVADARAAAWHAWSGLARRGQDPLAVGVTGIALNAARYVRAGRRLGTGSCGRGAMDLLDRRAQRRGGFHLVSLDRDSGDGLGVSPDPWRERLAEDRHTSPADTACFRLDFASWLAGLPGRNRRVAELLAEGHPTGEVARLVGVSPGRVSQLRVELEESWRSYQAGSAAGTATVAAC
jgi:DNA-directed RNA polymerase specialized sigma24 family protein